MSNTELVAKARQRAGESLTVAGASHVVTFDEALLMFVAYEARHETTRERVLRARCEAATREVLGLGWPTLGGDPFASLQAAGLIAHEPIPYSGN